MEEEKVRQTSGSSFSTADTTFTSSGTGTAGSADVVCGCPQPGPATIDVEQVLGANMEQRVLDIDMVVPDVKPDIEQVIDVYVKNLEITSVDVIPNKVVVRGTLEVKVMYVAALPNQPVHAFELANVRWTRDIMIEGAQPGMKATADAVVEYVNYDFEEGNPRAVHVTVILKVWARVVTTTQLDVYALTPVDEVGETEATSASASQTMTSGPVSASTSAGQGESQVEVTPVSPTAGVSQGVSGSATVTADRVNVRTGPGTNFPVLTQVNKGAKVTLKDQAFGWYRAVLEDGNTTGWIAGWLLNIGAAKG